MILVDTSVLISVYRGHETPAVSRLRQLEAAQAALAIPAICAQELLQGARDQRDWLRLLNHLESQHLLIPSDGWAAHRGAARIYFECRRSGVTVRSSVDCLIAWLAIEHEAVLLHDDDDFDHIASVAPLHAVRG